MLNKVWELSLTRDVDLIIIINREESILFRDIEKQKI